MSSYFSHPFVSNSDLTKLKQDLSGQDAVDTTQAFLFGTLVHAMILEPHTVDLIRRRVVGTDHEYSIEDFNTARKMKVAYMNDAFCRMLIDTCRKEEEMYHEGTRFQYNGIDFTLDTRRKYDLWNPMVGWGGDLKSTTATSQAQFEEAVCRFDYDRARVFYAAGSGATQDVIIGVSKINFKVFKVFMKAGDPLWRRGEEKMNELAFKYWTLRDVQVHEKEEVL